MRRRLCHLLELALTSAECEARPFAMEVEATREVDRQRQLLGKAAVPRREPHRARLALDRNVDARERADLLRPDARATDDGVRGDPALRCLYPGDGSTPDGDAGRRAALQHCRAQGG